jgi:protein-S-isoprenylcysteine O-methyltransferase Ste14
MKMNGQVCNTQSTIPGNKVINIAVTLGVIGTLSFIMLGVDIFVQDILVRTCILLILAFAIIIATFVFTIVLFSGTKVFQE